MAAVNEEDKVMKEIDGAQQELRNKNKVRSQKKTNE